MENFSPAFLLATFLLTLGSSVGLATGSDQMHAESKIATGLTEDAELSGVIRVIVEVAASEPLENSQDIPPGHCENVECAKLRLERSLENTGIVIFEPLEGLPLVVMEVTAEGLLQLENSPYVSRVTADAATGNKPIDDDGGELSAPQ